MKRAVDSVLRQNYKNFELIIVDDGSNDDTKSYLKLLDNLPNIFSVSIANSGVSHARNIGIDMAKGEWIALLDSDDEWHKNRLSLQIELLNESPNLKLIHGEEIWIRNGKKINPKKIHKKSGGFIFERCLSLCLISPSASLINKEALLDVGGFDENFEVCEDYDLWLKMTSLYEVGFVSTPIINKYGGHEDQLSAKYKAMDLWRVRSLVRILEIRALDHVQRESVIEILLKKSRILKFGYIKHQNFTDLPYIEEVIKKYSQ